MRVKMIVSLGFVGLLVAACSDDTAALDGAAVPDSSVDTVAGVAPSAEFKTLTAYEGIQGTKEITATVSASVDKLELLADGKAVAEATQAPFTISFDSTKVSDGVIE